MFVEKRFPEGWQSWKKTEGDWVRSTAAIAAAAEKAYRVFCVRAPDGKTESFPPSSCFNAALHRWLAHEHALDDEHLRFEARVDGAGVSLDDHRARCQCFIRAQLDVFGAPELIDEIAFVIAEDF